MIVVTLKTTRNVYLLGFVVRFLNNNKTQTMNPSTVDFAKAEFAKRNLSYDIDVFESYPNYAQNLNNRDWILYVIECIKRFNQIEDEIKEIRETYSMLAPHLSQEERTLKTKLDNQTIKQLTEEHTNWYESIKTLQ